MNDMNPSVSHPDESEFRLPRIALMGEFSAGKSTLANLMIGSEYLPVQVVATQLPPVWITWGDSKPVLVHPDGTEMPCDLSRPENIDLDETAYIRVFCEEEILKHCEIIDLPGISDPNMSSAVWERMLPLADGVIWCSPATQAWRQSEAAVWQTVPQEKYASSILLLTRADMLVRERDRERVLRRVRAETDELFAETFLISLLLARDSGEDEAIWEKSGAEPFVMRFLDIVEALKEQIADREETSDQVPLPVFENADQNASSQMVSPVGRPEADTDGAIVPRRPKARVRKRPRSSEPSVEEEDDLSFAPKFS
ncbi:dynamin family protein [Roseobacter sp. S98]|uniref:dynamin family protein n=1 Tax=Roseobacter algicola (ex Choi et al. 2025) (nom. illeg.) TaxID=3092138 RepID=UPI0035C68C1A